jgi:hypothetical protein
VLALNCRPCSLSLTHQPSALRPFPSGHRRQRPDDRRFLPLSTCLYSKDTEATVLVVEGDALDQAGNLLGRGSALWDRGVHALWGFIFPRMLGLAYHGDCAVTSRRGGLSKVFRSVARKAGKLARRTAQLCTESTRGATASRILSCLCGWLIRLPWYVFQFSIRKPS